MTSQKKLIFTHNRHIISEFRDGFFSIMNHYFVVVAELMEKFLICGDCTTPIGFPHASTCNNAGNRPNEMNFKWKKSKIDDKFITYAMRFCFNEMITPASKKDIVHLITSACERSKRYGGRKARASFPPASKSWPLKWIRNTSDKNKSNFKLRHHQQQQIQGRSSKFTLPIHIAHPPIFHPSIWTPTKDSHLHSKYEVVSFSYQQKK